MGVWGVWRRAGQSMVNAVTGKTEEQLATELFNAMGKALSPASTSALMDLLALGAPGPFVSLHAVEALG